MEELESQIAKIALGNLKQTNTFVHVMAEKAQGGPAELYLIAELPILNPAAQESCEQICLSIASTLKRSYRKTIGGETFENAISQINEELGKLAGAGQTHWINKLHCIIAVKDNSNLTIATCGKVAAFLLRKNEFTDISCSSAQSHPLKTFENFATGKIRLDDLIVFSTAQLFNYLSIDRLKQILIANNFLSATQIIIELLKQNAGPQIAFGMILNLQAPPGQTKDEEIDLEDYVIEKPAALGFWVKTVAFIKATFALDHFRRTPSIGVPKISLPQQRIISSAKNLKLRGLNFMSFLGKGWAAGKNVLDLQNFKSFSPQRKFFFISAFVLLVAFIINITATVHYKKVRQERAQIVQSLQETQKLLANSQASLLYNDSKSAVSQLLDAENKLPKSDKLTSSQKDIYQQALSQIADLKQKLEKVTEAKVTSLGNLSSGGHLIILPKFLAVQVNKNVISYNIDTGQIQDGKLQMPENSLASAYAKGNFLAVYNGSALAMWDFVSNKSGQPFSLSVPEKDAFGGMKYFSVNSRVYVLNKSGKQIVSFLINKDSLSKPVIALKDTEELNTAADFAVDGNIYILTQTGVEKFLSGKPAQFDFPTLFKPLSGKGKIYTEANWANIYLLDAGNNRILIINKRGNIVATLVSNQFTKMVDFSVDENNKTIYVLNDSNLLKVTY